jgi:hypothetical protein
LASLYSHPSCAAAGHIEKRRTGHSAPRRIDVQIATEKISRFLPHVQ